MNLDDEGLADPTCVVFSYLCPRDQAALRSTSRIFVQRFNRAVWYGCGIPYAGCQTVFKTLEEANEATETGCRWSPVSLLQRGKRQSRSIQGGTLLMDVSCSEVISIGVSHPGGRKYCQLLTRHEEGNLMLFQSVIVVPSKTASDIHMLSILVNAPGVIDHVATTAHLDLRAFDHIDELMSASLSKQQAASLNFVNHLPKMVSIGDNVAYFSNIVGEVHLCNLHNLEIIGSSLLNYSQHLERIVLENLPCLRTIGPQFCGSGNCMKEFSAKKLPLLQEIGGGMLRGCVALESVSFVDCPKLHDLGDDFLQGSGGPSMLLDFSGLPALTKAPTQLLRSSRVKNLRFIAAATMKEMSSGFLLQCQELEEVQFENTKGITSLGDSWMEQCTRVQSISFEAFPSLTSVGSGWLQRCRALKRLDLSPLKKLETIGDDAFRECLELEECSLNGLSSLSTIGGGFLHGTTAPCTLKVRGCRALASIQMTVGGNTVRRLKAVDGAKDLPRRVRSLLEGSIAR